MYFQDKETPTKTKSTVEDVESKDGDDLGKFIDFI